MVKKPLNNYGKRLEALIKGKTTITRSPKVKERSHFEKYKYTSRILS
jgi:hypothetical protein